MLLCSLMHERHFTIFCPLTPYPEPFLCKNKGGSLAEMIRLGAFHAPLRVRDQSVLEPQSEIFFLLRSHSIASPLCSPSKPWACRFFCRRLSRFLRSSISCFWSANTFSTGACSKGSGM